MGQICEKWHRNFTTIQHVLDIKSSSISTQANVCARWLTQYVSKTMHLQITESSTNITKTVLLIGMLGNKALLCSTQSIVKQSSVNTTKRVIVIVVLNEIYNCNHNSLTIHKLIYKYYT